MPSSRPASARLHRGPRNERPRERRLGAWALLGVALGALLAALWFAPARWLAAGIAAASDGRVQLEAAQGTIWRGSGALVLTGGAGSRDRMGLPGRVHWRLRPIWPGLAVQLRPDCCAEAPLHARLQLGWSQGAAADIYIDSHRSQWPASLLQGLGAPWNTIQLDGDLGLQLGNLHLRWQRASGRVQITGTAEASLRHAASRLSTVRPLGSYRLIIRGPEAGGEPTAELHTDSGPLMLSGQGQWRSGRLRFTGHASAEPDYRPALSNLLSLLGRHDGERVILNF